MSLFRVHYYNGAIYSDCFDTFVGVYSTEELGQLAGDISLKMYGENCGRAYYEIEEITVDEMP